MLSATKKGCQRHRTENDKGRRTTDERRPTTDARDVNSVTIANVGVFDARERREEVRSRRPASRNKGAMERR